MQFFAKFGTLTHNGLPNWSGSLTFLISKTPILYTQPCVKCNRFIIYTIDQTTLCICNEYLIYTTLCSMQVCKGCVYNIILFKNTRWRTADILKSGKAAIEQYLLMRRPVRVKSAIHRVVKSRIICYVIYFTYVT